MRALRGMGERWYMRAMEQRPAADLLRPDGISPIHETRFAERGAAGSLLQWRCGADLGYRLPCQSSEWHDGANADGRWHAPLAGKGSDCGRLRARWEDPGGGPSCEPQSATGVSRGKSALHNLRLSGLCARIAQRQAGCVSG